MDDKSAILLETKPRRFERQEGLGGQRMLEILAVIVAVVTLVGRVSFALACLSCDVDHLARSEDQKYTETMRGLGSLRHRLRRLWRDSYLMCGQVKGLTRILPRI